MSWTAKQVRELLRDHEGRSAQGDEQLQVKLAVLGDRIREQMPREAYEARHEQLETEIGYLRESFDGLVHREEERRNYVDEELSTLRSAVREAAAEARGVKEAGEAQRTLEGRWPSSAF